MIFPFCSFIYAAWFVSSLLYSYKTNSFLTTIIKGRKAYKCHAMNKLHTQNCTVDLFPDHEVLVPFSRDRIQDIAFWQLSKEGCLLIIMVAKAAVFICMHSFYSSVTSFDKHCEPAIFLFTKPLSIMT